MFRHSKSNLAPAHHQCRDLQKPHQNITIFTRKIRVKFRCFAFTFFSSKFKFNLIFIITSKANIAQGHGVKKHPCSILNIRVQLFVEVIKVILFHFLYSTNCVIFSNDFYCASACEAIYRAQCLSISLLARNTPVLRQNG